MCEQKVLRQETAKAPCREQGADAMKQSDRQRQSWRCEGHDDQPVKLKGTFPLAQLLRPPYDVTQSRTALIGDLLSTARSVTRRSRCLSPI
jgi:hypothetical protein